MKQLLLLMALAALTSCQKEEKIGQKKYTAKGRQCWQGKGDTVCNEMDVTFHRIEVCPESTIYADYVILGFGRCEIELPNPAIFPHPETIFETK